MPTSPSSTGGVDPYHPDLNVVGGYDCVGGPKNDRGWYDRDGHGTFVAGTAAAIDNGIGFVGIAPGARIHAVRVAITVKGKREPVVTWGGDAVAGSIQDEPAEPAERIGPHEHAA